MPDKVKFKKNGLYGYTWNGKKRETIEKRVKKSEVLRCLRSMCEIDEDVTLGDIFRIVDQYRLLKSVAAEYAWCPQIDEFHSQAKETFLKKEDNDLEYLEIYWHVDHWEDSFEISTDFHGIGRPESGDMKSHRPDGMIYYSVSYSPTYDLEHLPVKLNDKIEIYNPLRVKKGKLEEQKLLVENKRCFSLLEVLDAIYYDISFVGGPAENKAFLEDMKETVDEIKDGLACIPFEQVFKDKDKDKTDDEVIEESEFKILLHPDVARAMGIDPDSIPLDDKEYIKEKEDI